MEYRFRPDPPLDIGGLPAAMRGQASGPSSRREVEGGKASQTEAPTPGEPPELKVGGSSKALPTKMAPNREQVLETTCGILECIHALHLQTMHEMGAVQEVDRTLARTLMAKFVRLQLIVGEDLTKSLMALHTD